MQNKATGVTTLLIHLCTGHDYFYFGSQKCGMSWCWLFSKDLSVKFCLLIFFVSSDYKHKTWFLDRLIFAIWKFVWCPVVSGLFFLNEARFISTAEFLCVIESVFLLSLVWWIMVTDRLFVVSIWSAEYLWWCILDAILNIGVHLVLYLEESAAVFNCDF